MSYLHINNIASKAHQRDHTQESTKLSTAATVISFNRIIIVVARRNAMVGNVLLPLLSLDILLTTGLTYSQVDHWGLSEWIYMATKTQCIRRLHRDTHPSLESDTYFVPPAAEEEQQQQYQWLLVSIYTISLLHHFICERSSWTRLFRNSTQLRGVEDRVLWLSNRRLVPPIQFHFQLSTDRPTYVPPSSVIEETACHTWYSKNA